jgi:hypothetical protein
MGLKEAHQNKLEAAVLRPEKWIFFIPPLKIKASDLLLIVSILK